MQAGDCLLYLFGRKDSIHRVASSRVAVPTGIALVLLTAVARNYDQTFIGANPFLWLFGPLLFSLVSGTWLYAVAYGGFARRGMAPGDYGPRLALWSGWRSFMGLFWMTAPVAWLYAIPVERFLQDVPAARANVALLCVVAAWRVGLMARVLAVLCRTPLLLTLCWVLVAAAVEVLVVVFFGGGLAREVAASMGGMRNSPAEEVVLAVAGTAFVAALLTAPLTFITAMVWRPGQPPRPLPEAQPGSPPWPFLAVAAVCWLAVSVAPQLELWRTFQVKRHIQQGRWREALDFLSARQPGDFAPAQPLPPRPFERELFEQLPPLIAAANDADAPWVRDFLLHRLDQLKQHLAPPLPDKPWESRVTAVVSGFEWTRPRPDHWADMLGGLQKFPEGRAWLATNAVVLEALARTVASQPWSDHKRPRDSESAWRGLAAKLLELGGTNAALTNLWPPAASSPANAASR